MVLVSCLSPHLVLSSKSDLRISQLTIRSERRERSVREGWTAIDGDGAMIGALYDEHGGLECGSAYLFGWDGSGSVYVFDMLMK